MHNITAEIATLKQQFGKRLCIMGHHYQNNAVVQHCDITGDSLELARRVAEVAAEYIVFCGVSFMGESAALLAGPGQSVYVPNPSADCLMARMTPATLVRCVLEQLTQAGFPAVPLAYVNTDVALKSVVGEFGGAVCTSANAKTMLQWALDRGERVLFLPDRHLGNNTATQLGVGQSERHVLRVGARGLVDSATQPLDRRLLLWPGCCAIHARFAPEDVEAARDTYPGCRIIAHPECCEEVIAKCDAAGSTAYLIKEAMRVATTAPGTTLVIGTENNLVSRLANRHAKQCRIVALGHAICGNMAKVTEKKLLQTLMALADGNATPMVLDETLVQYARIALTRMLDACGH